VRFDYDANHNRYRKTEIDNSGTTTTHYMGKAFEVIQHPSGVTEYRQYITAAGETVAVITERTNNTNDTRYLHGDHQGTVVAITDASGQLISRYHYDPFGQRQEVTWTDNTVSSLIDDIANRGYTQHENLAVLGLIHMNGRVYDPKLGRFLSADPFVQFPTSTQGYNRYSYVGNNPLSFTDPSGYFSFNLRKELRNVWNTIDTEITNLGDSLNNIPDKLNNAIEDNPRVTGAGLALVGVGLVVIEAAAGGVCAGVCANLGYSMIGTGVAIILGGSSDPNAAAGTRAAQAEDAFREAEANAGNNACGADGCLGAPIYVTRTAGSELAEVYADSGNVDSLSIDLSLLGSTGFGPSEVFTGESYDVAIIQFIPIIVRGIQIGVRVASKVKRFWERFTAKKPIGKPFDPTKPKGSVQIGVNPNTIRPGKDLSKLDRGRLRRAEQYGKNKALKYGQFEGKLRDGNHRLRNAIDKNRAVDVIIE